MRLDPKSRWRILHSASHLEAWLLIRLASIVQNQASLWRYEEGFFSLVFWQLAGEVRVSSTSECESGLDCQKELSYEVQNEDLAHAVW